MTKKLVYCTLQIEGTHNWPDCPIEEVDYLKVPHRHMFHVKAYKEVDHSNRATEFIFLKHQIKDWFDYNYYSEEKRLHVFGHKSCEMICEELIEAFGLHSCDVSEDLENGSLVFANGVE